MGATNSHARLQMTAQPLPALTSGDPSAWDQALYAFLVEKGNRSGSRRTVESYSHMLWPFFAERSLTPDRVKPAEPGRAGRPRRDRASPRVRSDRGRRGGDRLAPTPELARRRSSTRSRSAKRGSSRQAPPESMWS
jgi:hypothetical protein